MAEQLRIILVGPTGLDDRLRFRQGVELVHVANALDAIAELADPLDADSPARSVVIVAPSRCPSKNAGDFLRALREVEPAVRVVLATNNGKSVAPFDATIDPAADESDIRIALAEPEAEPRAEAEPKLEPTPKPEPADAGERTSDIRAATRPSDPGALPESIDPSPPENQSDDLTDAGDASLVAAMLHGHDVLALALEALAERLGPAVTFVNNAERDPDADPPPDATEVRWHDRVYGYLDAPAVDPQTLAREAMWLAGWLRLSEQQKQLREAALTDPLTGAWNRRYFDRFLPVAIERARKARSSLTVLVFDIDDFKRFNTQFGHAAGDDILIETVKLLRSTIRPTDRVCRIGGDEFCVIFHEPAGPRETGSKPPENVYQISKRFQQSICDQRFPKLGLDAPGTLSISGGLATYPWDGRDAKELLDHADQLSLQSKQQGKNAILLGPGAARVCGELG